MAAQALGLDLGGFPARLGLASGARTEVRTHAQNPLAGKTALSRRRRRYVRLPLPLLAASRRGLIKRQQPYLN